MKRELNVISMAGANKRANLDFKMREGIVKQCFVDNGQVVYLVEVIYSSHQNFLIRCLQMVKFGGIFNYEEYVLHGYTAATDGTGNYYAGEVKAGDRVIVAFRYGDPNQGIILGCLQHMARFTPYTTDKGQKYEYEFNGLHVLIDSDGAYTLTFRGTPINASGLNNQVDGKELPNPKYNTVIGGSLFSIDKAGNIVLNDSSLENPQSIEINKAGGFLKIKSGDCYAIFDKNDKSFLQFCASHSAVVNDSYEILCSSFSVEAADTADINTSDFSVEASTSAIIASPQIAIGTSTIELLQKICDALGKIASHVHEGTSSLMMDTTTGMWTSGSTDVPDISEDIKQIQSDISSIKGSIQ